ncbi:MAG: hypothetical protein CVT49_06225 [candidate division Zixibacteria bacterium HGW-Zixibacteria-1]|nr:MAG: hypothetical protein CVT49_06225 [candidate division Zixibacteria bacterium HGW-Zixibacteria-1]
MSEKAVLNIIYTNIGRGHPFYLDGIVRCLKKSYKNEISLNIKDVFELSSGVSLQLWKTVRALYHCGSQGGPVGHIYNIVRKRNSPQTSSSVVRLMAGDIRKYIKSNRHPTLVAHPILVPMIADLAPVYYQHGENAVPAEAIIRGAKRIFVPTSQAAAFFSESGINKESIYTSGLCVENELTEKAEQDFNDRLRRLERKDVLTGAFFSSGAEPRQHVRKIVLMMASLAKNGQRAIVLCRKGGRLEKALAKEIGLNSADLDIADDNIKQVLERENAAAFSYSSRSEEIELTNRLFSYFDYFVAPSHERTNWALGLGLPMFIVHPIVGTFSPLNRQILLDNRVAADIDSDKKGADFSSVLMDLNKEGILAGMARNGFGKYNVDGFQKIAKHLAGELLTHC